MTGFTGSGKTTLGKGYSDAFGIPYIGFDENWGYGNPPQDEYLKMIDKYGDEFITDAIPYPLVDGKFLFLDYYNEHKDDIKIV